MAGRRSDPVRNQAIIADYERLQSAKAVGAIHGITGQTVYYVLGAHGIPTLTTTEKRKLRASDETIVALYRKLRSGIAVAKQVGISYPAVYRVLAEQGIQTREEKASSQRILSDGQVDSLIKAYRAGTSALQLARDYHCAPWTILAALTKAGIAVRRRPRIDDNELAEARRLYESGIGFKRVAEMLGRSDQAIMRSLTRNYPDIVRHKGIGPAGTNWKGGRTFHHGYPAIWLDRNDPFFAMAQASGYVAEHRIVMARKLGRMLLATETVHHIDGDKANADPSNLELRQGRHGKHVVMCCLNCGSRNIGHVGIGQVA